MYYPMLVGIVFLSMTVCVDAMQDSSSSDSSSKLIRVKLGKRTPSDKAIKAKDLPKANDPYFKELKKESKIPNSLYKKKDKV